MKTNMTVVWLIRNCIIVVMKPWVLFYNLAMLTCIVIIIFTRVPCTENEKNEKLERQITSLYQTVYFMAQRPQRMNLDAVYGITLVEAHVKQVLKHENMECVRQSYVDLLFEVVELAERSRRETIDVVATENSYSGTLNLIFNRPEIWMRPISWSLGLLGPRPLPSENNTMEAVIRHFHQGTPDGPQGDRCMLQLAKESTVGFCQVSNECAEMLLRDDHPRGYPLTHRLLYVQIAIALRCKEHKSTPFEQLISGYCKSVLQDAVDMEDVNFPRYSRDLIVEQVLLCGREGFTEFVNDHYASLIMSWSNAAACYSATNDQRRRSRRTSKKMDFGCDGHTTALAAASLSIFIRHTVETL